MSKWAVMIGLLVCASAPAPAADAPAAKKVVFLAGKESHHQYEKGLQLLKHCLDTSPNLKGVVTELHVGGWPANPATLDDADTIVLFSDGLNMTSPESQHPMLKDDHLKVFEKQMKRGCGLVMIHWALWMPNKNGAEEVLDWVGGYCCYQANGLGQPAFPSGRWADQGKHPILRGVRAFELQDEYFGNVRWRNDDPRLVPVLPVGGRSEAKVWAWAVERADGGRGFATIYGHSYKNWSNEGLCKTMLNAIVWTAKLEVPQDGVLFTVSNEPAPAATAPAAKAPPPATEQEIAKVEAALPAAPATRPQKPRKLLVYTRVKGFVHDSIPLASKMFELLGKKTGAFTATITDDPQVFAAESLATFDAVLMNNSSGALTDDAALQKNLIEFVRGGKGIIGIHGATWNFGPWPEYVNMMGADFAGHPFSKISVKLDDPASPINAAFKGRGFEFIDEIYVFKKPYSRQDLHVLLSIDWEKSATAQAAADKIGKVARADNDYALSWIRPYGQGRVYYCAFGHHHTVFWNPAIQQHLLAGIQYALGDLKADDAISTRP